MVRAKGLHRLRPLAQWGRGGDRHPGPHPPAGPSLFECHIVPGKSPISAQLWPGFGGEAGGAASGPATTDRPPTATNRPAAKAAKITTPATTSRIRFSTVRMSVTSTWRDSVAWRRIAATSYAQGKNGIYHMTPSLWRGRGGSWGLPSVPHDTAKPAGGRLRPDMRRIGRLSLS